MLYLFMVSNFIRISVTKNELALERERWVDRIMKMIHHVKYCVILDCSSYSAPLSRREARTMRTFSSPRHAYIHSHPNVPHPKCFIVQFCMYSFPYIYIFCLSASPLFSYAIFLLSWPLHLFLWIQYPLIMGEWFSWVWPIARIGVHWYFCLNLYVYCLAQATSKCNGIKKAVAFCSPFTVTLKKTHPLELMNKQMEAWAAAARK